MNKRIIALIGLVIAAGGSFGAFLAVKNKNDKKVEEQNEAIADNMLFNINYSDISDITIECADGTYKAKLDKEANEWLLEEASDGDNFKLNQETMKSICTYISSLSADTSYGEATEENKASYGLADPYKLTVSDGSKDYTIYIGSASPTNDYFYAMAEGKNKIYAIPYRSGDYLLTDKSELIANDLIPYKDFEIKEIAVKKNGELTYSITYDPQTGLWSLPDKYSMLTVKQSEATSTMSIITRADADQVLEKGLTDLSKYGFDDPDAEVTIKGLDGTECNFLVSRKGFNSEKYAYVLYTDTNQVLMITRSSVAFIDDTITDYVLNKTQGADLYTITDFSFTCGDTKDSFEVDMQEKKCSHDGEEIDLSSAELSGSFEALFNSVNYIMSDEIDIEAKPDKADAVFSAEFTDDDGSKSSVMLVPTKTENRGYVFKDGKYIGVIADYDLDDIISKYKNFCNLAGIEAK